MEDNGHFTLSKFQYIYTAQIFFILISKTTIDNVYEAARVEEVIGDFVQLKRAGSNFKALSPFSDERSPSFMVSPAKGIWKDFSSGKGGNAIAFVMEHEHFTYPEAIRYLAKKYNIEIEETVRTDADKATDDARESMYLVSEFAQKYFHDLMLNTTEGMAIGLSYFKERGFSMETIKKFGLGYSPETWDAFTKEALGKGYKLEFLESTGLTIAREDRPFDRFKGRVMFPIQSMSGRTLGFGGRILTNDKKAAKYLNSPESDLYHKSKVLYGIFHAKQSIAKENNCYLVEGYTDVIQMHQAGISNVVSSSGTALTPDQIRLINRLTKNITVLFDGDAAGLRAAIRGIDLILEEGMNVRVCSFPDGEDPDSFAKNNSMEQIKEYLSANSKDFIQFKASLLVKEANNDPVKKADLIRDMVVSISKVQDRIQREIYVQECARIMDISEQVLVSTLAQITQKEIAEIGKKQKQEQKAMQIVEAENPIILTEKVDILNLLEKNIVQILVLYGHFEVDFENVHIKFDEHQKEIEVVEKVNSKVFERIYLNMQEDEIAFANPVFKTLYETIIAKYLEKIDFESNLLTNLDDKIVATAVTDILMDDEKHKLHKWFESKKVYVKEKTDSESLSRLVTENIIAYREQLIRQVSESLMKDFLPETDSLEDLKETMMDYNKLKVSITRSIGRMRTY